MIALILLLSLFLSTPAIAAVAFNTATSDEAIGASSLTYSHTAAAGNPLVIVSVFIVFLETLTTLTHDGNNMTAVDSVADANGDLLYMRQIIPSTTDPENIVVTPSASTNIFSAAMSFTGVHQVTPLGTAQTEGADIHTTGLTITVPANGLGVDMVHHGTTGTCPGTFAPNDGGMTSRYNVCFDTNAHQLAGSTRAATGAFKWTGILGAESMIAVPINEAAATGAPGRRGAMVLQ